MVDVETEEVAEVAQLKRKKKKGQDKKWGKEKADAPFSFYFNPTSKLQWKKLNFIL